MGRRRKRRGSSSRTPAAVTTPPKTINPFPAVAVGQGMNQNTPQAKSTSSSTTPQDDVSGYRKDLGNIGGGLISSRRKKAGKNSRMGQIGSAHAQEMGLMPQGGNEFGGGFRNRGFGMGRQQRGFGMGRPSFMTRGERGFGMGRDQRGMGMGRGDFMQQRGWGRTIESQNPFAQGGGFGRPAGGFGGSDPLGLRHPGNMAPRGNWNEPVSRQQQLAGLKQQVAGMTPRERQAMSERRVPDVSNSGMNLSANNVNTRLRDAMANAPTTVARGGGFQGRRAQAFPNMRGGGAPAPKGNPAANKLLAMLSDVRVKENIIKTGVSPSGIPIYEFNYIGDSNRYSGAMAQDLLEMNIDAVSIGEHGYYMVNYNNIDVDMHQIN